MISLKVQSFQWVKGPEDDPGDQCAHGRVHLKINGTEFVKPEDGLWTVSAAALYLLRTLTENHSIENSVAEGNLLFPCCGFNTWLIGTRFKVMCMGCPSGINPEVLHESGLIRVRSIAGSETLKTVEWKSAVVAFAESVMAFYRASKPKVAIDDEFDRQGWTAFWEEWNERYANATSSAGDRPAR